MKYQGTYACGHEGEIELYGPSRDRQWKFKKEFEGLCDKCNQARLDAIQAQKREEERGWGWPELTGSEKQVEWANRIRRDFMESVNHHISARERLRARQEECIEHVFATKTRASYWIDNRNIFAPHLLHSMMEQYENEKMQAEAAAKEEADALARAAKEEALLAPDQPISDEVVDVSFEITGGERGNIWCRIPSKNETFRVLMHKIGFSWKGAAWKRFVGEKEGPLLDRTADVASKLLANGFRVSVTDADVRQMVIDQRYAPEHERWIDGWGEELRIYCPYSKRMAEVTSRVKGARWDPEAKRRKVPISSLEEVQEMARLYDFRFTRDAEKAIAYYKQRLARSTVVQPQDIVPDTLPDPLKEILDSSREVLDDLKDE